MLALRFICLYFVLDLTVLVGKVFLVKRGRYVLTEELLNLKRLHRLRPVRLSRRVARHRWSWLLESRATTLVATGAVLLANSAIRILLRWIIALKLILIVCSILRRVVLLELIASSIGPSLASKRGLG